MVSPRCVTFYEGVSVLMDTRPAADIRLGCNRHPFDDAVAACHRCHAAHCQDCIVFPFGVRKPGLCIPCALVAGGIRRR